jgi:hypothetical protein
MLCLITFGMSVLSGSLQASTDNYSENFESYSEGSAISNVSGWTSTETNSVIVSTNYSASYVGGDYPIPGAHTKVLNVQNGVTNTIAAGSTAVTNYLDVVINPVYADDTPDMPPIGTVAAVYFTTNGYPVVMHTPTNAADAVWVTNTSVTVSEDEWIRLTIAADFGTVLFPPAANPTRLYQVYINGVPLSNSVAYTLPNRSSSTGGSWFGTRRANAETSPFTNVMVKGTGYIDDMVVTNNLTLSPPAPAEATYIATLPSPSTLTEGETLGDVILTGGSATNAAGNPVPGSFDFALAATNVPPVGTNAYDVVFTPTDTGSFLTSTGSIDVVVLAGSTTTTNGTPTSWYDTYLSGQTATNTYDELDMMDSDGDGQLNWREYLAGTRPDDSNSIFRVIGVMVDGGGNATLMWTGGTNGPTTPYIVESVTNLGSGAIMWVDEGNAAARAEGTNTWVDTETNRKFYRVRATD